MIAVRLCTISKILGAWRILTNISLNNKDQPLRTLGLKTKLGNWKKVNEFAKNILSQSSISKNFFRSAISAGDLFFSTY
jgi:hypothetical protein